MFHHTAGTGRDTIRLYAKLDCRAPGYGSAFSRRVKIFWREPCYLSQPGQHPRVDVVAVVKRNDDIRPTSPLKDFV